MRVTAEAALSLLLVLLAGPGLAQSSDIGGNWHDEYGTTFAISQCGGDNNVCAVLRDLRGDSRTVENLAFLNRLVLQATPVAANKWQGTLTFNGMQSTATITQLSEDRLRIRGCQGIICGSLEFSRS